MNVDEKNNALAEALENYFWVSISPEYPKESSEEVSEDGKEKLSSTASEIQNAIISIYEDSGENKNIGNLIEKINPLKNTLNSILRTVNKFVKRQPELADLQKTYHEIAERLNKLENHLENIKKNTKKETPIVSNSPSQRTHRPVEPIKNKKKETPIVSNSPPQRTYRRPVEPIKNQPRTPTRVPRRVKPKEKSNQSVILVVGIIIAILAVVWLVDFKPSSSKGNSALTSDEEFDKFNNGFSESLSKNQFQEAGQIFLEMKEKMQVFIILFKAVSVKKSMRKLKKKIKIQRKAEIMQ